MACTVRVCVPIRETFRQIAKLERRSIAQQAAVALDTFEQQWRSNATPQRALQLFSAKEKEATSNE
jgi:hypothetical protein